MLRPLQRLKRVPEGKDSMEELLREQEQFYQEKPEPAAKLVKPKVSRFKQMQDEMRKKEREAQEEKGGRKEPELEELDVTEPGIRETVTEHKFTVIPPIVAAPCSATFGFPSAKPLLPSLRAKPRPQLPTPTRSTSVLAEADGIDEENTKMLHSMSGHDVKEQIDSVHIALGDRLSAFLQKRGEMKIKNDMRSSRRGTGTEDNDVLPSPHPSSSSTEVVTNPCATAQEDTTKHVRFAAAPSDDEVNGALCGVRTYRTTVEAEEEEETKKPYELSISDIERKKMEWMEPVMAGVEENEGVAGGGTNVSRYDFQGNLLAPDEEGTYPALYHHGEDPHRAGYATHELLLLARSSDLSQRATALKILENVVKRRPEEAPEILPELPELLFWLLTQRRRPAIYLATLRIIAALENVHTDSRQDLLELIEDSSDIFLPRMPQSESCSGWTAFFTAFVKPRTAPTVYLDPKQLLDRLLVDPKEPSLEIILWQMRSLRGLANLGHDVLGCIPRSGVLQFDDTYARMELVRLICASSQSIEGASWWLEDQDTLTLVRQAILTGAREEGVRTWCLWLDHGLGMDEDVDCFLPELMRLLPHATPRQQCVLLRYLYKVNLTTTNTREVHRLLVHSSHSTCITTGAPFVREAIAALVETPWTYRPLRRLRALVEPIWPPTIWPAKQSFALDGTECCPLPSDREWGIFAGAPMAPFAPSEAWVDRILRAEETHMPGRDLPCAAPLWEVGVPRSCRKAALRAARDAKNARSSALEFGVDLPIELWQPCEDWCSAVLAPFIAVKQASATAILRLLEHLPKLEAPDSVVFLALCVVTERFSTDHAVLAMVDRLLVLPFMPQGGLPFPEAFTTRLVDMFEALMQLFTDFGEHSSTLVRMLACFAAEWAPAEVRRKFWLLDPHFPILLCHAWKDGDPLVGDPGTYKENDPDFHHLLEPYRSHTCATMMPLVSFL
eukprot:GEMP01008639.1.p1 GENE.GEMP01008639.1~~GEMP01008639.1.p1  ORF type:complete len:970 (+),score=249.02 GEMP01008639.1:46-2910(+)